MEILPCYYPQLSNHAEPFQLQNRVQVIEHLWGMPPKFTLQDEDGNSIGMVRRRLLTVRSNYDLLDNDANVLATGVISLLTVGTDVEFTDSAGEKIGSLTEKLLRINPEYHLRNAEGKKIAIVESNFWRTRFVIRHPQNEENIYATMTRPFFNFFRTSWELEVTNPKIFEKNSIDPRILFMFPAIQTDKDNAKYKSGRNTQSQGEYT